MRTPPPMGMPVRLAQVILTALLLGTMLMVSACGSDAPMQQQVNKNQTHFDSLLKHAQAIGVPGLLLQPLIGQEQALSQTHAPFSLFNTQNTNEYYSNVSTRYLQLAIQLQGIVATSTERAQNTAQHNLQALQTTLAQKSAQGLPVQNFIRQLNQERTQLHTAQYPKDYAAISAQTKTDMQALNLLQQTAANLMTLRNTIGQMQNAQIDITWLQEQYASDQQTLTNAITPTDFQKLGVLINAQYLQAAVHTTQAIPYVAEAKLNDFANQIQSLKSYGGDITVCQKELDTDQAHMKQRMNLQDYITFSKQIDTDMTTLHSDLVKNEASYLVNQFHQEVNNWGNAHLYHDTFNGQSYPIDAGYMQEGIGSDLDGDLGASVTTDDFQNVVNEAQNDLFNLHMLEADNADNTPYNQPHNSDLQILSHYNLMHGQVIVVSLAGQTLRVYQDGNLVRGFQVTTGRPELPSLPGVWPVQDRESPTVFKSPDPKGSPYWYPDTPIHYAILYHSGGYFLHDSWWRADYGPGTQFPHNDSGGDESFAGDGSHGCVNLPLDQAGWLYNTTNWQTQIVIY
jgi:L,D-transpeptidase catalytic domain